MTTLSPGFCPNCEKQTDTNFKYCEHCAADLSQFRQQPQPINQAPTNAGESSEAKSLKKRYKDAYRVARTTTGIGLMIKRCRSALGHSDFLRRLCLSGQPTECLRSQRRRGRTDSTNRRRDLRRHCVADLLHLGCAGLGARTDTQASLDGAVNGSPFLTNEQRATIMSL